MRRAAPALTNLNKVYWPVEGYTKGDLFAYYRAMAPVLLPYLRDRPMTLHRHPNGIAGKSFFQKDVTDLAPDFVPTARVFSESREALGRYVMCQDEATLLYVVNLGCIELNPWNSRADSPDQPDYLILDLDPVEVPFKQVVRVARVVREVLETLEMEACVKTSGKRGLHVCLPLAARYRYDQVGLFAELIARTVAARLPEITSLERSPARRQGRVYLDCLQNRRGQTLAAPYSVRPVPGACVSTPLRWREISTRLDPAAFTMRSVPGRVDRDGDRWQSVLGPGIDLEAGLKRLPRAWRSMRRSALRRLPVSQE